MTNVRIYRPAKTAMQSGTRNARVWVLEFEQQAPREIDPLMGWTSSRDTTQQVRLKFPSEEAAIAYAKAHGLAYTLMEPHAPKLRKKAYADNFRYGRIGRWTH